MFADIGPAPGEAGAADAYAALADRELWHGEDMRDIDGLEARVALDIANLQRKPDYLPE